MSSTFSNLYIFAVFDDGWWVGFIFFFGRFSNYLIYFNISSVINNFIFSLLAFFGKGWDGYFFCPLLQGM